MFDVHTFYLETVFTDVCRSSTISGKYTKYSELGIRRLGFRPRQKNVPSSVNSIQFRDGHYDKATFFVHQNSILYFMMCVQCTHCTLTSKWSSQMFAGPVDTILYHWSLVFGSLVPERTSFQGSFLQW
uniref:Uncharacterized protein n=1 Tax=Cacopsylla melanoneura TaxID=428564 RepID=A0A8D8TK24_9HEMI